MVELSIIVPVYNVEKYLSRCLDSLVNQTYKDIEIIIVNDGSTDSSQQIIDDYLVKYDFIKSYYKENGGLGDARNYGVKKAQGKYITFVDSDDYVDLELYQNCMNKIKNDSLDIVLFGFIREMDSFRKIKNIIEYPDIIHTYLFNDPNACNKVIKKDIWLDNGLSFPKKIWYEDLAVIPSLVKFTKRIGVVDGFYYHYIIREGSITSNKKYNEKCMDVIESLKHLYKIIYSEKMYSLEFEFIFITQGIYMGTQRVALYNKKEEYNTIINYVSQIYPNWKNSIFIKDLPLLKRIYVYCVPHFFFCKLLVRIRNFLNI